jgi:CubicO group peptidase (beta-lactamase class C family)
MFADAATFGTTYQLFAIRDGEVVYERHGEGQSSASTCLSWSMAKSWTMALVGVAIRRGILPADLDRPVWTYWSRHPGWDADPFRRTISMHHLLTMRDGLLFREEYVDGGASDVIPMLNDVTDMGVWSASKPCAAAPGTRFNYSSGTTNVVADILGSALCPNGGDAQARREAFLRFFEDELAGPLGCSSMLRPSTAAAAAEGGDDSEDAAQCRYRGGPKFDGAGTFVGSSFLYATAGDFARLPLLFLRGGEWGGGRRLLDEEWCAYARRCSGADAASGNAYGAHWWLDMFGDGTFSCNGFEGQFAVAAPESGLVVVRLGKSSDGAGGAAGGGVIPQKSNVVRQLGEVVRELGGMGAGARAKL